MGLRKTLRNYCVSQRIERHPDVSSGNFKVDFRILRHAIAPVDNAVMARVNRGLEHRVRNVTPKAVNKAAGAATCIAIGQNSRTVLVEDSLANSFGGVQDRAIRHGAAKRRSESDDRSDLFRPLACDGSCDHAAEAVTDQMNLSPGLGQSTLNSFVQMTLDQEVGAIRIDADSGKVRAIPDAAQPGVEFRQVKISAEKARNNDYARIIAMRHSKAIVDRGRMQ